MRNAAVLRDLFLVELQLLNTLIGNWVCACGCLCAPWEAHCPACRDEQPLADVANRKQTPAS